jgi:alpha-mannosidase
LAAHQSGDFEWKPMWDTSNSQKHSLLTHNMPFDMYFVDASCGPHTMKCKPYDFRWYGAINDGDVQSKSDQLIDQYRRSASLYSHNVFLAIVGGDFRYDTQSEFDQQYNYKKIIDYVNSNKARYKNAKMQFGTPKDYFRIIKERTEQFPTLVGDFFPYVDVFTSGKPGYWTGYYTTVSKFTITYLQINLKINFQSAHSGKLRHANSSIM